MKFLQYDVPIGASLLERHIRMPESVEDYIDHGFTHFEYKMVMEGKNYRNSAEMLDMLEQLNGRLWKHGLRPWSLHLPPANMSSPDEAEREEISHTYQNIIRHVSDWGIRVITMHTDYPPKTPEERPIRCLQAARTIRELRDCAANDGMRIAVEDLPRQLLGNTSQELYGLISASGGVGCCFDVNHLFRESHEDFMRRMGKFVITTHISDCDDADEKHWLPGEGRVPFRCVMDTLQSMGYRGPYLFEVRKKADGTSYTANEILGSFRKALEKR